MPPAARSWNGCVRCRKRRQKCDEQKPHCARCQKHGQSCTYEKTLRFGGRPFSQSRFGTCLSSKQGGARKTATSDGGFVYTAKIGEAEPLSPVPPPQPVIASNMQADAVWPTSIPELRIDHHQRLEPLSKISITRQLDMMPSVSLQNRGLFEYFTCNASRALAPHTFVHQEICKLILPMALDSPALLHATLALAAVHRYSTGFSIEHHYSDGDMPLVNHLTGISIQHLRNELQSPQTGSLGTKLATIRTLFLCEAISGSPSLRTWRAHFLGAQALISSLSGFNAESRKKDTAVSFLCRWYEITEALVAVTNEGLTESGTPEFTGNRHLLADIDTRTACIDAYTGCAEDLPVAYREIGAVAWERRRTIENPSCYPRLSEQDFQCEADYLELSVRNMIRRDKSRTTVLKNSGTPDLSVDDYKDFVLCNEAYQITALIHIHRRIRRLPPADAAVQECVQRIVECVGSIKPAATLSPLTLLTTPLFTAGCEAIGRERIRVAQLLNNMFTLLRVPNMKRALQVLEVFWHESDARGIFWEEFSRERGWDFLPY
ncbi:fungal-specific transcription factor domain-containing protein [Exophiala viscosa]|uniref:Fungal-specific transcription factor domain-containing protein n=1 Tax=Exophiala viscosa TaxID=2486360 RepID=A0AAN6ICF6_9EURO|nr:fungal-specific transcription factor domain-containing protein [Exophiala viscosa]KAI1619853.1 fungal-specific transcription factor domain-containing protein [Exophiala viscosa]